MDPSQGIDTQAIAAGLTQVISSYGLRVLGAIALLIVGWIASKIVRGSVRKLCVRGDVDETLTPFIASLSYYAVLTFVLVAVLSLFGIETTSFIAVLGAMGFAVGLAMQGTLSNFASGVMLLVFRPFDVGDFVEAAGQAGSIREIGIFSTVMHTGDNIRIVVPNSSIYGGVIRNYSANETRRNDLVVGISYDDDIGKAMETIRAVLAADSRVLKDPEPVIAVSEMADSSVNLVVRPWCDKGDYWPLRFDLTRSLKERLEQAGCSIPYPQTDIHVHRESAGV